jgi:predicted RecA/RadA family phage recombinase
MPRAARTAVTILVLLGLLAAALAWGWSATTSPFPESAEAAACTVTEIAEGEQVYPDQVLVSVLNAGTRDGLASRTMQLLVDQGFVQGDRDNAPTDSGVETAEVWTDDPDSPAVRLVASWLGKGIEVRDQDTTVSGVVVVVGDGFADLAEGRKKVKAKAATSICVPPPPAEVIDPDDPADDLIAPE